MAIFGLATAPPQTAFRCRGVPNVRVTAVERARMTVVSATFVALAVSVVFLALTCPAPNIMVMLWGLILFVLLLVCGGTKVQSGILGAFRPLLAAGTITAALGFALIGFGPDPAASVAAESRSLIISLCVLIIVLGVTRMAIAALVRPRVALVVDSETAPAPSLSTTPTVVIELCAQVRANSEAVAAAVVPVVEDNDITHVELDCDLAPEAATELSWQLRRCRVPVGLQLDTTALSAGRAYLISRPGRPSLVVEPPEPSLAVRAAKRAFDIIVATVLALVLAPVMIAVALTIKITMPGPVFFFQERIGRDGQPFKIIKFRSMIVDADATLAHLLAQQQSGDTPLFKVTDDPRITPLGRMLRRYSLDELPQLFNVLGGTMSLVGPRPQRAEEVALYTGTADHRLGVLPGMTGLWQVSGRSNLSWEQAQELDVYYAHNWSLGFDLLILSRTFAAVVRAAGAV